MTPFSFTELFQKYSDFTDKETVHFYGIWYDRWCSKMDRVDRILELGCDCFGGGGLMALAEKYPEASVVGVDIGFACSRENLQPYQNVSLHEGDVYDDRTVTAFCKTHPETFDLIIDDCLHTAEEQVKAFRLWSPRLASGGLYIIEDVTDLSELSKTLARWSIGWNVTIGESREVFPSASVESTLLCLKRF